MSPSQDRDATSITLPSQLFASRESRMEQYILSWLAPTVWPCNSTMGVQRLVSCGIHEPHINLCKVNCEHQGSLPPQSLFLNVACAVG
jgi:hypothetical protein